MAAPVLSATSKTCLGCLRWSTLQSPVSISTTALQVRGKKNYHPKGSMRDGVVVRLTQDFKAYGPKGTLMRITRGKYRNQWFSRGIATRISPADIKRLKIREEDIAGPDPSFGAVEAVEEINLDTRLQQLEMQATSGEGLESTTAAAAAASLLLRERTRARKLQKLEKEKMQQKKQQALQRQTDPKKEEARRGGVVLLADHGRGIHAAKAQEAAKLLRTLLPSEFSFCRPLVRKPSRSPSSSVGGDDLKPPAKPFSHKDAIYRGQPITNPVTTNDVLNGVLRSLAKSRHPDSGKFRIKTRDLAFVRLGDEEKGPETESASGAPKFSSRLSVRGEKARRSKAKADARRVSKRKANVDTTGDFYVDITVRGSDLITVRRAVRVLSDSHKEEKLGDKGEDDDILTAARGGRRAGETRMQMRTRRRKEFPTDPETETPSEAMAETNVKSDMEFQMEPEKVLDTKMKTEPKMELRVNTETETTMKTKTEPEMELATKVKTELKMEPKVNTETETVMKTETEPKIEPKTEPTAEMKTVPKMESQVNTKTETRDKTRKAEMKMKSETPTEAPKKKAEMKMKSETPTEAPKKKAEMKMKSETPTEAPKKKAEMKMTSETPTEAPKKNQREPRTTRTRTLDELPTGNRDGDDEREPPIPVKRVNPLIRR